MTEKRSVLVICGFISNPGKFDSHIEPISEVAETKAICINPSQSCDGVTFRRVPTFGSKIVGLAIMALVGLYEVLTKDYDLIVTYSLIPYGLIGLFLSKISRTPVHLGIIGSDLDVHAHGKYSRFVKWCFRRFDTISVKGSAYEEQLLNYGVSRGRIFQLFNPPSRKFELATPNTEPTYDLLWLTRMSPEKNPVLFIDILTELRDRDLEFSAAMVGGGPLEEEVRAAVVERGLEDVVDLPGWSDNPIEYFEDASIYVLTSDRDMLPISLLEAMYCGTIPICPAIGAIPDIIDTGDNGMLVQNQSVNEYCNRLEEILVDGGKRQRLNKSVREIRLISSHSTSKEVWSKILCSNIG